MNEVEILRGVIDRQIRPANKNAATATDRDPSKSAVGGRPRALNYYDQQQQVNYLYGLYGRRHYGTARYSQP